MKTSSVFSLARRWQILFTVGSWSHLNYYVYGKVSWDNSANVERLLTDYRMRMFGPTLVEYYMGSIIDDLEEKWTKKVAGRVIDTSVGPKSTPPSDEEIWEN